MFWAVYLDYKINKFISKQLSKESRNKTSVPSQKFCETTVQADECICQKNRSFFSAPFLKASHTYMQYSVKSPFSFGTCIISIISPQSPLNPIHLRLLSQGLFGAVTFSKSLRVVTYCELLRCRLPGKNDPLYLGHLFGQLFNWRQLSYIHSLRSVMHNKTCILFLSLLFLACCMLLRTDAVLNPQYNCRPCGKRSATLVMKVS